MPYMKPYNAGKQKGQAASLRSGTYKMAEHPEYVTGAAATSHSQDMPYKGKAHDAAGKRKKMKQPAHAQGAPHDNPKGMGYGNPHKRKRGGDTNGIGGGAGSGGGVGGAT